MTTKKFNCTVEVARWVVLIGLFFTSVYLADRSSKARNDEQQEMFDARQKLLDRMEAIGTEHQEELDRRGEWMEMVESHIDEQTADRFRGSDFRDFLKLNPDLVPIPVPDPNTD